MSARSLVYPTRDELLIPRNRGLSAADRLRARYVIEQDGCWRWTRSQASNGYGHLSIRSIYYQTHLLMYVLEVGPLPAGLEPDHLCRHRYCVRPSHLEFVTHAVNVQRGSRTVLTPGEVEMIRAEVASGISQRAIGRARGIDHSTVSRLVNRVTWAEPEPERQAAAA